MNQIHSEENMQIQTFSDLLRKRFEKVYQVGIYKKLQNIPPLDETRWQQVLSRIVFLGREKSIPENFISDTWNEIHEKALNIEKDIQIKNEGESYSLEELRNEINEIDEGIISVLGQMFAEQGEEKLSKVVSQTIQSISFTL